MQLLSKKSKSPRDSEVGEPPPFANVCPTISNSYPSPAEYPNYVSIGPGYLHKNLYRYMKQKVADLHKRFRKVKSRTGFATVKIFDVNIVPEN